MEDAATSAAPAVARLAAPRRSADHPLATRTDESRHHLRSLASHGFITDTTELGRALERASRTVHRSTWLNAPDRAAPERKLGEAYLRTIACLHAENVERSINELPEWPQE